MLRLEPRVQVSGAGWKYLSIRSLSSMYIVALTKLLDLGHRVIAHVAQS